MTDYQITDADIGRDLGVPDGYLVRLRRTRAPTPSHQTPDYDEGRRIWKSAYLQLRASGEAMDMACVSSQYGGGWAAHYGNGLATMWDDASIHYRGDLKVLCVPRGSVWEVTLSDVPVVRAPAQPWWNFDPNARPVYRPVPPIAEAPPRLPPPGPPLAFWPLWTRAAASAAA
jgi:hypothetical protein